jgi:hypothetical protein
MATVHELSDTLAERLRDLNATAFSRADLRTALSTAQRAVNIRFQLVLTTVNLTTQAQRVLYPFVEFASDCVRVIEVIQSNRRLDPVRYAQLRSFSLSWLRATGSRHEAWAPVGRDLLAIYPALLGTTGTVSITYVPLLPAFDDEENTVSIPDDYHPLMVNLALLLLCARGRLLEAIPSVLTVLQQEVKMVPDVPR